MSGLWGTCCVAVIGAAILLSSVPPVTAGTFTVDDWRLSTVVQEESGGPISGRISLEPSNPFCEFFAGDVGTSHVSTQYDIAWSDTSGSFRMDTDLAVTAVGDFPPGQGYSDNTMWITPAEDVRLVMHSEYAYDLPVVGMSTSYVFLVDDSNTGAALFAEAHRVNTMISGESGTLGIDADVVLPAGQCWEIFTRMHVSFGSGSNGHQATGSGFFDIQLMPVPEPTTAVLLSAVAIPLVASRRRSHH